MSLSPAKQKFVDLASEMYGAGETLDKEMVIAVCETCLLYTSPSPRDVEESRMPSSA